MVNLHIQRVFATLTFTVPDEIIEVNMGYSPFVIGDNLAGQVDAWVMEHRLGYYPAIDYFQGNDEAVDQPLLELMEQVARYSGDYAVRECRKRLSHSFSSAEITQIKSTAYSMPRMRPHREGGPSALAMHYAPNRLRAEMVIGCVQKHDRGELLPFVKELLIQQLTPVLDQIEVVHLESERMG